MVAGLIASELGLDLYQVDLSKIVSKWIGETEKNLSELFDAAEAGHAILLFDEADSLFAGTPRRAVEQRSLRQPRGELPAPAHGVVRRRGHPHDQPRDRDRRGVPAPAVVARRLPGARAGRARLWRAMLPAQAAISGALDFATLGQHFAMTGGYIKNAALRAAFLAADDGQAIAMRHLVRAARAEYQAMGKVIAAP